MNYHDKEWGRPSYDEQHLFEMMVLESFQAGLSWYTILAKRENFRQAFAGFDVVKVSNFNEEDIARLMDDVGIVRNRAKILAAIHNASLFMRLQQQYGKFSNYIWQFTDYKVIDKYPEHMSDVPSTTAESDVMAKDMKKRGFKFMGSTVCYANMQSIGMVNDHLMSCRARK